MERWRKWLGRTTISSGSFPEESFPMGANESVFTKSSKVLSKKSRASMVGQLVFQCDHVCPFNGRTEALCKTWKQFKTLKRRTPFQKKGIFMHCRNHSEAKHHILVNIMGSCFPLLFEHNSHWLKSDISKPAARMICPLNKAGCICSGRMASLLCLQIIWYSIHSFKCDSHLKNFSMRPFKKYFLIWSFHDFSKASFSLVLVCLIEMAKIDLLK